LESNNKNLHKSQIIIKNYFVNKRKKKFFKKGVTILIKKPPWRGL